MSFHEHLVDVLIRVPFTGLVDGVGTLAQRHGCHAIVLSYHDVSPAAETDQLIIHCICNGEQVAGFKDIHTGKIEEVMLIRRAEDLETFKTMYGIEGEITKEY